MQGHTEATGDHGVRACPSHGRGAPATRTWRTRHGAQVPAIASLADAPMTTLQPYFSEPGDGFLGGCLCQTYGKSGVPYPSGKCMVCGYRVNLNGAVV